MFYFFNRIITFFIYHIRWYSMWVKKRTHWIRKAGEWSPGLFFFPRRGRSSRQTVRPYTRQFSLWFLMGLHERRGTRHNKWTVVLSHNHFMWIDFRANQLTGGKTRCHDPMRVLTQAFRRLVRWPWKPPPPLKYAKHAVERERFLPVKARALTTKEKRPLLR